MPIQYPDAPQFQVPNLNLMGAFAQGQAMGLNRLRERALENELAQQEGLRNVMTQQGFNINDPRAVQQLVGAGAFDEALKLKAAQDMSAVHRALQQNYINEVLIRGKTFEANLLNIKAMTKEHLANADKAQLQLFSEKTGVAQDLISRTSPDTWAQDRVNIRKLDPTLQPPTEFDEGWNERALRTAKTMQDVATDLAKKRGEAKIPKVVAPTAEMPGMLVTPRGVSKLPELTMEDQANLGQTSTDQEPPAPVVRPMKGRLATDFELPKEVMDLQRKMAVEEQIKRTAPMGREKEALGAYRFSNTLKDIGTGFIDLAKANGVSVPGESSGETFAALANKTKLGQVFGKLDASKRLALVDQLRSLVSTAIPQFAAAAGLQSKNFDSNVEGERLKAALADPDNVANISSAFGILNNLNKQFGTGGALFEPGKEEEKIIRERRGGTESRPSLNEIFK